MPSITKQKLLSVFNILYKHFGQQHWWPGETPFEVMVGAILTQNTNWSNVEKAIINLKKAKVLDPSKIKSMRTSRLAALIKPSGFFNIKAQRLKTFIAFIFDEYDGDLKKMEREETEVLRKKVLSVKGIGPETADSILLYALNKPVFVVDAYTKRVFSRHGVCSARAEYNEVQEIFQSRLPPDVKLLNEYHALLVTLAKQFCRTKPLCKECPLNLKCFPINY